MIPTPFQTTGQVTTWADEQQFWVDLAADSPRVRVDTIGTSVGGRPITLIGIGATTPPPAPTSPSPSMLVVAYQHGHEVGAREGAIEYAHRLAYTTDPDELAYLADHPVWIIPAANPDSIGTEVKENLQGLDLNRDHVELRAPETRAIHTLWHRLRPHIVTDLHEGASSDAGIMGGTNSQIDPGVRALGMTARDTVIAAMIADGFDAGLWGDDINEQILRNAAALRHHIGLLMESHWVGGSQPLTARVAAHAAFLTHTAAFHADNAATVADTVDNARAKAVTDGQNGAPVRVSRTVTLDPAPLAYILTDAQHAAVADLLDADGIEAVKQGSTWRVSMAQEARHIIPLALDPDAAHRRPEVAAERSYAPPPAPLPPPATAATWGPVKIGDYEAPVTAVSIMAGGEEQIIWTA